MQADVFERTRLILRKRDLRGTGRSLVRPHANLVGAGREVIEPKRAVVAEAFAEHHSAPEQLHPVEGLFDVAGRLATELRTAGELDVEAGVASIMTAHILFPDLDGKRPATISRDVMAILRDELGYDGVVFSDDLEMKAVADHHSPQALVEGCLEADVDAVLVCRDAALRAEVLAHLEAASDARLARALARVAILKQRFAGPRASNEASEGEAPPYPAHQELAVALGTVD